MTVAPLGSLLREEEIEMDKKGLAKVQDAEKESLYGFVFAVSGPGELESARIRVFLCKERRELSTATAITHF